MANNPVVSVIKINNVDYDIKDAQARADLAALFGSENASAAIDSFNEVIAFLAGVTNTDTLVGKLNELNSSKADKSATVSDITYNATNRQLSKTINGTTTLVVTIPEGVAVDSSWIANSVNPVQSKIVKAALDGKAEKSEMDITDGTGADTDKVTIQLKSGTSVTVLKTHQDITGKVDKETGKGLSTNDYTTAEKNKLAGIAAGAEVNVQSDWSQATTTADDYIKNKPTNLNQFANGPGYQTAANVNSTLADVYDGYDSTTETISFTFPTVS